MQKRAFVVCSVGLFHAALTWSAFAGEELNVAATAVNSLGVDLLSRVAKPNENALFSPYSIQSALAMTYAGAAGETKTEMGRVLHYPQDEAELHASFAAFREEFDAVHEYSVKAVKESTKRGGPSEPVILEVANRLYGQSGYTFRPEFLAVTQDTYGAAFQPMDFLHASENARGEINRWVAGRTNGRIADLVPPDGVNKGTRLALVNAIYFKAPWANEFSAYGTRDDPFFVGGTKSEKVRTMQQKGSYGYVRGVGFQAIALRYVGGDVQLLVLLPDEKDGLAALEAKLTPQLLADCANPDPVELVLHLPKFKLEPPTIPLGRVLQSLGLKTVFDQPQGSADFDRMARRKPDDYLYVSEVFHKAFLALDEKGTEAAAATVVSVSVALGIMGDPPKPIEVKVDHPFLFAIQHRSSGACLFLGRVVDPR